MAHTWVVATIVAVVAGVIGFFVVLRGSTFAAHAVPLSAVAGSAGAGLLGISSVYGLGVFALAGALTIGWLGQRGRHDVVTALAVTMMLGVGALFLGWSVEYAPAVYSLLFGEVLGVSANQIGLTIGVAATALAAVAVVYRPLLLASLAPEVAAARGVRVQHMDLVFLVVLAVATTTAVPVVGALLMFSLMVGPPAAARCFTSVPARAVAGSVAIALLTTWGAIAAAYATNWPVGFFVGAGGAAWYVAGRAFAGARSRRVERRPDVRRAQPGAAPALAQESPL
jgi:zinc/manganese transport system permease protein